MRCRAVLIVATLAAEAHADDLRNDFGLAKKPEAPVACTTTQELGCVWADDDLAEQTPYALATWLPASYLLTLPVGDATHDQLASYALGGTRDEVGPVFGSGNGLENRWTLDGSPIDNGQLGSADTRIPLAFLEGMTVTAGGFSARDRTSLGGTIDAQLVKGTAHHEIDVRAYASLTGTAEHRPTPLATFQITKVTGELGPSASTSIVARGPLPHDAWYAVGIAPSLAFTDLTRSSSKLVDADGDNIADLDGDGRYVLDGIESSTTRQLAYFIPAMIHAGADRDHHHVDIALLGELTHDARFLTLATDGAAGVDRNTWVGDAVATYRGEWADTRVKIQAGWHRSAQYQHAHDSAAADIPQLLTSYIPSVLADDPTLAAGCSDASLCPVPNGFFASGGAGPLVTTVMDRPSISADITHRIGDHVLRAGATGEDTRLVLDSRITGGEQIRSLFPGHTDELRYYSGTCGPNPTDPCNYESSQTLAYRTRYTAAYAEDTFSPTKDLRVDGGLRWELMWVGTKLHFSDELSPRFGITWSLFDGHAKAWASMGRSFAMLPAGLGATILARSSTVSDSTVTGLGSGRTIDAGAPIAVAADIQPVAQDEVTVGIAAGLAKVVQLTAWIQGRWIERGLDTTPTGLDNPGTTPGDDPATRSSAILALQLQTTGNPSLRIGYQYGIAWGTWTGAYDPRQGAVLYAGDDYDSGSANLSGRLPANQGHRVFVEGERRGSLAGLPVSAALRLTLSSGRPRDVVADTDLGDVQLLPRGENGVGPMISQVNLRLATRWHGIAWTLDVFNLFDRRDATNLDQVYTQDAVMPVSGGSASDLIWLRNVNGDVATRSRTYGLATAFQAPVSATLGARLLF